MEIEKIIDISDPVYTFCEVMDHIDLSGYFVEKGYKTGHPRWGESQTEIQQCVIHQIRNSTRFVSYKDIKKLMADLKLVYTAPT